MMTHRSARGQEGFVLVYMAAILALLMVTTGLAVDSGRAYLVKAQLSKAVDGAALAAARSLNSGNPRVEATQIFKANFPPGYMGTDTSSDPTAAANFFNSTVNAASGVNVVTISATATLPTTFMRVANVNQVTVASSGEATRRMVDLSLILDVSGSIGAQWPAVRDAARTFVNSFDAAHDRVSLITFGDAARVLNTMPQSRGFDKTGLMANIPSSLPGGSTAMVEGLYRGWDQLRSVPVGSQSGLRVIVLFTDGASNSVPGDYGSAVGYGLRTYDFPQNPGDTFNQTWNSPHISGLYETTTGANYYPPTAPYPNGLDIALPYASTATPADTNAVWPRYLPARSHHKYQISTGIPTSFPLQTNALTVDGLPQSSTRGLRNPDPTTGKFPADVHNINNAARNLVEIIADAARSDTGDYHIRIYTIGMGQLVPLQLGTRMETSESILKRIANDARSAPDFNSAQLEGHYYYAQTAADVGPAFQALQNQILRLSK
jgi:Flp pilus assembly protein TadG